MTEGCEAFEIDSERRAHGALEAGAIRALDEHLVRCEHCRTFAALIGQLDERLRRSAAEAARQVRWAEVERRLEERTRQMRRSGWLVPVGLLGSAVLAWALGVPTPGAALMAAAALVVTAVARAMRERWLGELAAAGASREALLAFARRQVEAELGAARRASAALVALGAGQVVVVEALGRPAPWARAAVVGGGAMLVLVAARLHWHEVPRLERERAELA